MVKKLNEDISIQKYRDDIKFNHHGKLWDRTRKEWLHITKEEVVRQAMIIFLHEELCIPYSYMKTEVGLKYGNLAKRCDIVVYNQKGEAFIIIECKSFDEPLNVGVLEQVLRYHKTLQAEVIGISNGVKTQFAYMKNTRLKLLELQEMKKLTRRVLAKK